MDKRKWIISDTKVFSVEAPADMDEQTVIETYNMEELDGEREIDGHITAELDRNVDARRVAAIARVVRKLYEHESDDDHEGVAEAFADELAAESSGFDRVGFLKACGIEEKSDK